jgi:ABC-type antimicrobial peptide transport system permease subunit
MFYHLRIILRGIRRGGIYSFINTVGMAVSLATVIFIMLWVWDELSFDRFHRKHDRIFTVNTQVDKQCLSVAPLLMGDAVRRKIPGIDNVCRINHVAVNYLEYDATKYYPASDASVAADTSFFTMFDFRMAEGSADNIPPDGMVISRSAARTLFGGRSAVGEQVKADGDRTFRIVAVMDDMPGNSTMQYSVITFPERKNDGWSDWSYTTWIQLRSGSESDTAGKAIEEMVLVQNEYMSQVANFRIFLQNIGDKHLYNHDGSDKGMQTVRLFIAIGILILVIACINYVNLVTARASRRSRETGLRKAVGASKAGLLGMLVQEAAVLFICAVALAVVIVLCALPAYNSLTAKTFDVLSFLPRILAICGGIFVAVTLLAGLYPAYMLASIQPADAFRSKSGSAGNAIFRRALVVVQFVFSAGLMMGTLVMDRQLAYIQSMNPGYSRENVAMIPVQNMKVADAMGELPGLPGISGVTVANRQLCRIDRISDVKWEGKDPREIFMIYRMGVEKHFIETLGLKLVAGTNFTGTEADMNGFIVNETAARLMGFDDPVGRQIEFDGLKGSIIGVAGDFHFQDMHRKITSMVFHYIRPQSNDLLYARIEPGKTREALSHIETVWNRYNAGYQFTYSFLDETFEKMHGADLRTGILFRIFAVIAVLISCLGLFGLVTYTAESKTKETGIRKVLGARVIGIVKMLSLEFLILAGVAMVIAFPLAWLLMDRILQDYAYRITPGWWIFALAGIITVALTLITVGWKAVAAAMANPVKSIRSE